MKWNIPGGGSGNTRAERKRLRELPFWKAPSKPKVKPAKPPETPPVQP